MDIKNTKVWIKGAGDLATGVGLSLYKSGFKVVMTDIYLPTTVRRTVAFSSAVIDGEIEVEGVKAIFVKNLEEIEKAHLSDKIPIIVDIDKKIERSYKPDIVIDAIIAKKNIATDKNEADLVIAMGPGFIAGEDCHIVIETNRGHTLGKLIYKGSASENTGIPAKVEGFDKERIIRSKYFGKFKALKKIGDIVKKGEVIAYIDEKEVYAGIDGLIRGLLFDNVEVSSNFKLGDIDPRLNVDYMSISDKSRALGRACLEAVMIYLNKKN